MLELDWQGALQVKKSYPEAITVFVLPPSINELEVRLKKRRQDSKETISKRISFAKQEIQKSNKFDVLILNNPFKDALNDLKQVVTEQGVATPCSVTTCLRSLSASLKGLFRIRTSNLLLF